MTQRKRKSPEKKPVRKEPGILARAASALMSTVARHPAAVGGFAAFFVIFGFVAANALWYQPGRHPQPIFRTRDAEDFTAMAGLRRSPMIEPDPATTTTFRIERQGAEPATPPLPAGDDIAAIIGGNEDPADIRAVQQELARLGLYQGTVDGVSGPGTSGAIQAYQRSTGQAETGIATPELLAALRQAGPAEAKRAATELNAVVPLSRPSADSLASAEDPVAAAIRDSERRPIPVPPNPIPAADAGARAAPAAMRASEFPPIPQRIANQQAAAQRPAAENAVAQKPSAPKPAPAAAGQSASLDDEGGRALADANLIMAIQKGLSNIAYADVSVDGVAGSQTRAAIRHFERHYRLPETGEPNAQVLKKLKDIGAL